MDPMQEKTDSALPTNRRGNGEPAGIPIERNWIDLK